MNVEIAPEAIEAIALRVAELLEGRRAPDSARLLDATALAERLGVERDWVYAHARDLGAIRLGGPRGRLRFDLSVVRELVDGGENGVMDTRRSGTAPSAKGRAPRINATRRRPRRRTTTTR